MTIAILKHIKKFIHAAKPTFFNGWLKWLKRLCLVLVTLWLILIVALLAAYHFWLLPHIPELKSDLEVWVKKTYQVPLTIGTIDPQWSGLTPSITIKQIQIGAQDPIQIASVELAPSLKSLFSGKVIFSSLDINATNIHVARDEQGKITVNGIQVYPSQVPSTPKSDFNLANWLLEQGKVELKVHNIRWADKKSKAAPITLKSADIKLNQQLIWHTLEIDGQPAGEWMSAIQFRARWQGSTIEDWKNWDGHASFLAKTGAIQWWQRYLPDAYALPKSTGQAAISGDLTFSQGALQSLDLDGTIENWRMQEEKRSEFGLPKIGGSVHYQRHDQDQNTLKADSLYLVTSTGAVIEDGELKANWTTGKGGVVQFDQANLQPLSKILIALGWLDRRAWNAFSLDGLVQDVKATWQGSITKPNEITVQGKVKKLAWETIFDFPSIKGGLNGSFHVSNTGGEATITGQSLTFSAPEYFANAWNVKQLNTTIKWQKEATGNWNVNLVPANIQTPDFNASVKGRLTFTPAGNVYSNLNIQSPSVDLHNIYRYLPLEIGQDSLDWLRTSLLSGRGEDAKSVLKGDLAKFPFKNGGGQFTVNANIQNAALHFADDWPVIKQIHGQFIIQNQMLAVKAPTGQSENLQLSKVEAVIPDLSADHSQINITGDVQGELQNMLRYTQKSPVDGYVNGLLSEMQGSGHTALSLKLAVPLDNPEATKVNGDLALKQNTVSFLNWPIPKANNATGHLLFTESGITSNGIRLWIDNKYPMLLKASSPKAGHYQLNIEGKAPSEYITQFYLPFLTPYLRADLPLQIGVKVAPNQPTQIVANTKFLAKQLKIPVCNLENGCQSETLDLQLKILTSQNPSIEYKLGDTLSNGLIHLTSNGDLLNGSIGVFQVPPALPNRGIKVGIELAKLNVQNLPALKGIETHSEKANLPWPIDISADVGELITPVGILHNVSAQSSLFGALSKMPKVEIKSNEISGVVMLEPNGLVNAKLKKFSWPWQASTTVASKSLTIPKTKPESRQASAVRQVRLAIDQFYYEKKLIGQLSANINQSLGYWYLQNLALKQANAQFAGNGEFDQATQYSTFNWQFSSPNVGAFLKDVGYDKVIKGGEAELNGRLYWQGGLSDLSANKISGTLALVSTEGQFQEINPGIAKFLGLISLDAVYRLLKLDFSDLIQKGLSYDQINGQVKIQHGIMQIKELHLNGPSAAIQVSGTINPINETQDLQVKIEPNIVGNLAFTAGAAVINPVLGLATLAAQSVLKNPLNKAFTIRYKVTGTFDKPDIQKEVVSKEP